MNKDFDPASMRVNYDKYTLDETSMESDPMKQFRHWFNEAVRAKVHEPNMMTLSTVGSDGKPSSRIVLLKDIKDDGFSFYTNYSSRKGKEIDFNPNVSLVFLWTEFQRQVRIEGVAEKLSPEESNAYFVTRPVESQIGAIISDQSQILKNRNELDKKFEELLSKYRNGQHLLKPETWGGYLIRPNYIEFWQGRPSRLHDRIAYNLTDNQWLKNRLHP